MGLALGSGAARGWAHIGVVHALDAAGIRVDVVTGTSAGCVVGAFFAADALRQLEYLTENHKSLRDTLNYVDFSYSSSGLFAGKKWVEYIKEYLPCRRFDELKIPLGIVAADLVTLQEIHIYEGALLPAIRASISVPGFWVPEENGEWQLVDGGILNPVPVNLARKLGADVVIAVDLNTHFEHKKATSVASVMDRTIEAMMQRIRQVNYEMYPADVTIEPQLPDFGFMDYHRVREAVTAGYDATQARMADIESAVKNPSAGSLSMVSLLERARSLIESVSFPGR